MLIIFKWIGSEYIDTNEICILARVFASSFLSDEVAHNYSYLCNYKFTSQAINCFLQHYEFFIHFLLQMLPQSNHCLIRTGHRLLYLQFMGHKKKGTPFRNSSTSSFSLERKEKSH